MVLRDTFSATPELLNPWIQETATKVAKRLGKLAAIMEFYHKGIRGARGEDVCPAEMPESSSMTAWLFMLVVFLLGVFVGWCLNKCLTGRKAPILTRNVATQSQTTYIELRGCTNPSFIPCQKLATEAFVSRKLPCACSKKKV
jgi:hypothetical protein